MNLHVGIARTWLTFDPQCSPSSTILPSVLMLGLFLYSCWRRHKGLKEGVYHVSAHHGEWEDIRENVLNYDEEGGGEQDQVSSSLLVLY